VSSVELAGITVSSDDRTVLRAVELVIADGERVALLGPSGSGKTTLLRVIAGSKVPNAGSVRFDGVDVTRMPARHRDVAMVTQQGGLQPHLDVRDNLGFALRLRRFGRAEARERVEAEARAFSLTEVLHRRPRTLSSGQRHEVALARSLVRRAAVLLIDEPFARIDPLRRGALLRELVAVQAGYGVTMVLATNDQHIASGVAHRMVILDAGRVVQVGSPSELFLRPSTTFVASFLGDPAMNLFPAVLRRGDGPTRLVADELDLASWDLGLGVHPSQEVTLGIRPSDLHLDGDEGAPALQAVVRRREFLGHGVRVTAATRSAELLVSLPRPGPSVGERLRLTLSPGDLHVFDLAGRALAHGV
jgi:multiple sugar transport system ATP-binding protein